MATEITVRGSFSEFQQPERATVHAAVDFEGPDMQPVYDTVALGLEAVTASITPMVDGPVTWWSAGQLRTSSHRPWNQDGKQLPLVHRAGVEVEVKFRDFAALSHWVGQHVVGTPGFRVSRVEWALTEVRRDQLRAQACTRAVQDAVERAQQYADALGLGAVQPVAIADAGMLDAQLRPDTNEGQAFVRAASAGHGAGIVELVPEDIEVTAAVDARFVAG
ncbi:MAG: SIMPL domain-containing protein [Mycobacterium sp.]